jgi:hypothetical protein
MATFPRGLEIAQLIEAQGSRAVLDPALASPPCVLIIPPNLLWDQMCAVSATWQLVALAPAANTADADSWQVLDVLVDNVSKAVDARDGQLVAYTLNGKQYPSYLITLQESI